MKDNLNATTWSLKLEMKIQDRKGKEAWNNMVCRNSSKTAVSNKFKLCNFTGKVKNSIINNALGWKDELGEVHTQESEHKCPHFEIRQRNNFCFASFTGSPMHWLFLRLSNVIVSIDVGKKLALVQKVQ